MLSSHFNNDFIAHLLLSMYKRFYVPITNKSTGRSYIVLSAIQSLHLRSINSIKENRDE